MWVTAQRDRSVGQWLWAQWRGCLRWAQEHALVLGVSAALHVLFLIVFQLEIEREKPRPMSREEIPIELVFLPVLPSAEEAAVEEEVPRAPVPDPQVVKEGREPPQTRQRPLPAQPGPNVDGFRRMILAIDCTPEMATSSSEMSYACRRMSEIMDDLTADQVARLKARAAGIAYARGWALPPTEELEQETIRKETEKGAPAADEFGPMPFDQGPP